MVERVWDVVQPALTVIGALCVLCMGVFLVLCWRSDEFAEPEDEPTHEVSAW